MAYTDCTASGRVPGTEVAARLEEVDEGGGLRRDVARTMQDDINVDDARGRPEFPNY